MTQHRRTGRQTHRSSRPAIARPQRRKLGYEMLESRELLTITVEFQTTLGNFQVQLFDDVAPRTVANFLNYVTSDRFDGTFFHRSVPGFVVQGGGFSLGNDGQADSVVTDPPVLNEFSRSNLRGTLAMAKLGGDPNSATSQFFINLANNASNLDNQNGGFTVFGQVIGTGMNVVDAIAAVPRYNVNSQLGGGAFTDTPLQNYTAGQPVTSANPIIVQNVAIVGDAAPIVIPFSTSTVTVGEGQSLQAPQVQADEYNPGQTLTYSLVDAPDGATINPTTGQITWIPSSSQANQTYALKVKAQDNTGLSDVESFNVRVNDAPALTPIGDRTVAEGSPIVFQLSATDTDTPATSLTYSLVSGAPQGSTFDPSTRTFNWTPTEAQGPGTYTLTFKVTDDTGLSGTQTVNLNVTEVNQPPVLAPIGNKSVNRGNTLSFTVSATDADLPANTLTYSLDSGAPAGALFDPVTRTFTWTPTSTQIGTFPATIRVNDGAGGSDFETFALTVVRPNQPPTLDAIADQTVAEGSLLTLNLTANDPDLPDEILRFALLSSPQGAQLNDAGGFQFRPSEAQGPGTYPVTVQVIDSQGVSASRTFNISVTEVPSPPQLQPIANQTVAATRTLKVQAKGSDVDLPAQQLTYSLVQGDDTPAGASINPTTGQITWTPTDDLVGQTVTFTVTVADSTGLTATTAFQVAVTEAPKFDPAELLVGLPAASDVLNGWASGARVMNVAAAVQTRYPFVSVESAALQIGQAINRNESAHLPAGAPNFADGPDTGVAHIHRPEQPKEEKAPGKDKQPPKTNGTAPPTGNAQTGELDGDMVSALAEAHRAVQGNAVQGNPIARAATVPDTLAAQAQAKSSLDEAIFAHWDEELTWTDRPVVELAPQSVTGRGATPASSGAANLKADVTAPAVESAATPAQSESETRTSASRADDRRAATALGAGLLAPMLVTQLEEIEKKRRQTQRANRKRPR